MCALNTLPPELVHQIILKLNIWSDQCLLDLLNTFVALDLHREDELYRLWFCKLIELFKTQIQVIDFTSGSNNDNNTQTPTVSFLKDHFIRPGDQCKDTISNLHKLVLIIDDTFLTNNNTILQKFNSCGIQDMSIFERVSVDIFVCCKSGTIREDIPALLNVFDPFFKTFNNLVLVFDETKLTTTSRDFMGVLSKKFFVQVDQPGIQLVPRCNQLSIPSVIELNMDYLTIDSFIYNILELQSCCSLPPGCTVDSYFKAFLASFQFYAPDLRRIRFYNYRNEETCNFIDLSTPTLQKFKDTGTPLSRLFDLHSFTNWIVPSLQFFTGHRFKYDDISSISTELLSSSSSSSFSPGERNDSNSSNGNNNGSILQALSGNLCLLHELALTETHGSTPYFKVNLIPGKNVKHTSLLNWLPSENPNIFGRSRSRSNRSRSRSRNRSISSIRSDSSGSSTTGGTGSAGFLGQIGQVSQFVSVTPYATALMSNTTNTNTNTNTNTSTNTTRDGPAATSCYSNDIASYLDKPILCFENDSLKSLELKMMNVVESDSARTVYIQGLFLKNLEELTLQNYEQVSSQVQPQLLQYPSSVSSRAFIVPGGAVNGYRGGLKDDLDPEMKEQYRRDYGREENLDLDLGSESESESEIDDISPIGFSSWNDLPSCEYIHFSGSRREKLATTTTSYLSVNNTINSGSPPLTTPHVVNAYAAARVAPQLQLQRQQRISDRRVPLPSVQQGFPTEQQVTYLFKIKNLKMVLPKINLRGSFENFIDERQKYVIV